MSETQKAVLQALDAIFSRPQPHVNAVKLTGFISGIAHTLGDSKESINCVVNFRQSNKSRNNRQSSKEIKSEIENRFKYSLKKGKAKDIQATVSVMKELRFDVRPEELEVLLAASNNKPQKYIEPKPIDVYREWYEFLEETAHTATDFLVVQHVRRRLTNKKPIEDISENKYLQSKGLSKLSGESCVTEKGEVIVKMQPLTSRTSNTFEFSTFQTISDKSKLFHYDEMREVDISVSGQVHFLPSKVDCYEAKTVLLCEGFATGESLHQATELPTICVMGKYNYELAAISLFEFGMAEVILIAADREDFSERGETVTVVKSANPTKTITVCQTENELYDDFNDLMTAEGMEAVKEEILKALTPKQATTILDEENQYAHIDLAKHLPENHNLRLLSKSISHTTHIKQSTVILIGLGVFSSMACRYIRVGYERGGTLPIALYVVAEQPSGANKSRCVNVYTAPFYQAHREHIEKTKASLLDAESAAKPSKSLVKSLESQLQVPLFFTNATPEGLESSLTHSRGSFAVVSAEQGAFNSLLGLSYGEGKASNNDLVLLGFNGDPMSSIRVTREAFSGYVFGGVTVFAQPQSVDKILNQSNGTGLSERFLMLAEPHALGTRDFLKTSDIDEELTENYKKVCSTFATSILQSPKSFTELPKLTFDSEGWRLIKTYRNQIEPEMKDGGKLSHSALRGAASKIDMQIMKIAANLHLLAGLDLSINIPTELVNAAIGIANDLLFAQVEMLKDKGVMGIKAEWQSVISYLSKRNKGAVITDIINSLRNTKPFKDTSGNKSALIKQTVTDMVKAEKLIENEGYYSVI